MKKRIKLLLSLSSALAIATPVATIISCGSQNKVQTNKQLGVQASFANNSIQQNKSDIETDIFFKRVLSTISFSGVDGSVVPNDNIALNAGLPNASLSYVWTNMSHSGEVVEDYHQIKGMSDKDIFGIRVKPNPGIVFAPGQKDILTIPVTIAIYTGDFFKKVNSTIRFLHKKDGSTMPNDNAALNAGLANATLKYGWSLSTSQEPQRYVTDYHQLEGMSISNIFWIVVKPNDGYYLASGQQNQLKIKVVVNIYTRDFFNSIQNTISFSGIYGNVSVNDNKILNTGLGDATLKYGWTVSPAKMPGPGGYVTDYHQIKDMCSGYVFWVVVTPNKDIPMGEGQQTTLEIQVVSTIYTENFYKAIKSTISFSGANGNVVPNDNAVLNAGIPNATLIYGWTNKTHSGKVVADYHQLKGMSADDAFWIHVIPNQQTPITPGQKEMLIIPVTVAIYTDDFFKKVNSTIKFLGKNGSVVPDDNAALNAGLQNATLKYGWSLDPSKPPKEYVTDYHQLKGMSIANVFWIVVKANDGYYLASGQQNQLKIKVIVDVYTYDFFDSIQNTITFSGAQGSIFVNDNAVLNVGVQNAVLKYGWTWPGLNYPKKFVNDYHLLKDMRDGYKFWVIVTPFSGFHMGERQQISLQIVVTSNVNIKTQQFFSHIQNTISFSKSLGNALVNDNKYLDAGLKNATLKYGWTSPGLDQPSVFVTDYHQLKNMKDGYMFWVAVVPNADYFIGKGQKTTLIIQVIT